MDTTEEIQKQMQEDLEAFIKFRKDPRARYAHFKAANKSAYDKLLHTRYPNRPSGMWLSTYLEVELKKYINVEARKVLLDKQYRFNNAQAIKDYKHSYYESNKEYINSKSTEYKKNNPEVCRASNANRRAARLQRTPSWSNLPAIKIIYSRCPEDKHVDHIIPLQGRVVSGLHVENNLQYLSIQENLSKFNSFDITKFNVGDYNTENIVWPKD